MKKVFIYESVWENGSQFEGDVSVRVFETQEKAVQAMKTDIPEIQDCFLTEYDENDLRVSKSDNYVEIYVDGYDDCWTGSVYEQTIE